MQLNLFLLLFHNFHNLKKITKYGTYPMYGVSWAIWDIIFEWPALFLLYMVFFMFLQCPLIFLESQTLSTFSRSSEVQYIVIGSPLSFLLSKVCSFSFESLSSYVKSLRFGSILVAALCVPSVFLIVFLFVFLKYFFFVFLQSSLYVFSLYSFNLPSFSFLCIPSIFLISFFFVFLQSFFPCCFPMFNSIITSVARHPGVVARTWRCQ